MFMWEYRITWPHSLDHVTYNPVTWSLCGVALYPESSAARSTALSIPRGISRDTWYITWSRAGLLPGGRSTLILITHAASISLCFSCLYSNTLTVHCSSTGCRAIVFSVVCKTGKYFLCYSEYIFSLVLFLNIFVLLPIYTSSEKHYFNLFPSRQCCSADISHYQYPTSIYTLVMWHLELPNSTPEPISFLSNISQPNWKYSSASATHHVIIYPRSHDHLSQITWYIQLDNILSAPQTGVSLISPLRSRVPFSYIQLPFITLPSLYTTY